MTTQCNKKANFDTQMFYFDSYGNRLFGVLHTPDVEFSHQNKTGLIFCSPFGEERGFTQRLMVEWANVLCQKGYYVLRFDYRGYGDSDGLFEEYTIEDHLLDLGKAIDEYYRRVGAPLTGLCGIRLGASIAALGAKRFAPHAALILWEPIVNGDKYADLLLRGAMAKEMANYGTKPRNREQLKQCLANGEKVIIEGHPLTDDIYRSIVDIDLLSLEHELNGPVQIVQFDKTTNQKPRAELVQLKSHLSKAADVAFEAVKLPALWTQTKQYIVKPADLFDMTSKWWDVQTSQKAVELLQVGSLVQDHGNKETKNYPRTEQRIDQILPKEKPIQFKLNGHCLRGVLHLPTEFDTDRPALLLLSPGFNCRTARYRLYVRIAREAAEFGWTTLRYDPRGLGDSDGILDYKQVSELYNKIENGCFADDVLAAIEFIKEELGVNSVILIGVCGGAAAGIFAAAQTESVVGMVFIETPLCHTLIDETAIDVDRALVPKAQADQFLTSYMYKLFSLSAWRHFLSFKSDYKTLFKSITVSIAKRISFKNTDNISDEWFLKKLGPKANLGLISRLQMILNKGLPTFFIFGSTYFGWYFEEIKSGLMQKKGSKKTKPFRHHIVKDADPGYSLPHQSRELIDNLLNWLNESSFFPEDSSSDYKPCGGCGFRKSHHRGDKILPPAGRAMECCRQNEP